MIKRQLGFIVLIFLLFSCSADKKSSQTLSDDAVILAFGDSLTVGKGASRDQSYPAVLQSLSGLTVINDGVSGSLSSEGLSRLEASLEEHNPNLIIICYGGNDVLRNKSQEELKSNLAEMIEISESYGVDVILIGVPKKALFLKSLPLYQALANQYNVPVENEALAEIMSDSSNRSDTVHLNAQGYRLMAEAINELLQKSGLLN